MTCVLDPKSSEDMQWGLCEEQTKQQLRPKLENHIWLPHMQKNSSFEA